MNTFSLGTIDFNTGVADADGIIWFGYVEGWDALSNEIEEIFRPAQHGGVLTANLYSPKSMTVFGTAVGANTTDYYLAKNKILTETNVLTQFGTPELFLEANEEIDRRMSVLRVGYQGKCVQQLHLQFEMTIRADDPFKYTTTPATLVTSGTATNGGNTTTYPTWTSSGAGIPVLGLGGRTVRALSSLPSGTVIDFDRMTVLDGTVNYFGNMDPASDFFGLAPGNNTLTSTGVAGTWSWRDAWL
jgi:hypothetical protein